MRKANRILLLTMAVLLMTIKTSNSSNSSYIGCYSCYFSSPDPYAVDVCSNPAAHSDKVTICVGLGCYLDVVSCIGTYEECGVSKGIKVDRGCINETDGNADVEEVCTAQDHKPGHRVTTQCHCRTEKCNVRQEAPKSVCSLVKSVSSVALVTMVLAPYFVSSMINY